MSFCPSPVGVSGPRLGKRLHCGGSRAIHPKSEAKMPSFFHRADGLQFARAERTSDRTPPHSKKMLCELFPRRARYRKFHRFWCRVTLSLKPLSESFHRLCLQPNAASFLQLDFLLPCDAFPPPPQSLLILWSSRSLFVSHTSVGLGSPGQRSLKSL